MPRNYPEISVGLGKFTPDLFSRLMVMLRAFEEGQSNFRRLDGTRTYLPKRNLIIAEIKESESYATNRFKYTFEEVIPELFGGDTPTRNFVPRPGSKEMTGYNLIEFQNTADFMGPGVDLSAADFPDGMSPQAIADGTLVLMYIQRDRQGEEVGFFNVANAIDGSCS